MWAQNLMHSIIARYASARWALGHKHMTMTFDLLIPKTEAFILVPKCTKAESLVKFSPVMFKLLRYMKYTERPIDVDIRN